MTFRLLWAVTAQTFLVFDDLDGFEYPSGVLCTILSTGDFPQDGEEVPSHPITSGTRLVPALVHVLTWLRGACQVVPCEASLSPPSHLVLFGRKSPCTATPKGWAVKAVSLRADFPHQF